MSKREAGPLAASEEWRLSTGAQWCAGVFGLALVSLSLLGLACQFPTAFERDGQGAMVKSSRSVADLATIATACLLAGTGLLVYALNGVRLVRVGLGSLVAEGNAAAESAREYYDQPPTGGEQEVAAEGEAPEPTAPPATQIDAGGEQMSVFKLDDVPVRVILDALGEWPKAAGKKPVSFADFQFAARKKGKGNHPWTLKFRERSPVKVSYGGRGKQDGTVT